MSEDTLFRVGNRHVKGGGPPPQINADDPDKYYGYFENEHGEQALFVYDRERGRGIIRLGDAGWEHEFEVVEGAAPDAVLTEEEALWVRACWRAATAFAEKS